MKSLRLKIAYFSPLPPQHTGVADYSAELLPYLANEIDVTLFVENPAGVVSALREQFTILPLHAFPEQRWQYDLALYHIGNNHLHETIYDMAIRYPGVVVLHDYFLHPHLADRGVRTGDFSSYQRELAYARGMDGIIQWRACVPRTCPPLGSSDSSCSFDSA